MVTLTNEEEKFARHFYKILKLENEKYSNEETKVPFAYSLAGWFKKKYFNPFGKFEHVKELFKSLKKKGLISFYYTRYKMPDKCNIMISFNPDAMNAIFECVENVRNEKM